ncbi:MAG: abortive infection family protein [Planctomycetaceae bacterium]|nr:abortive infection family protein [Planctomycetaceae bacterium]
MSRVASAVSPYRSGPKLVTFFNEFGSNDVYGNGFPTRYTYVQEKLRNFNDSPVIASIIQAAFDRLGFEEDGKSVDDAVVYFNRYLKADGFEVYESRGTFRLRRVGDQLVEVATEIVAEAVSVEFIEEQLEKCRRKLSEEDYDGAITNARSLIEAVLHDIESKLTGKEAQSEGDLIRDYKRVQKILNLEPSREDISNSLRQVLTGLTSIVSGIAPLRNRMSDAHARSYKPSRHHAKLVVNSAQTLVDFLFETFAFQQRQGTLKGAAPESDD